MESADNLDTQLPKTGCTREETRVHRKRDDLLKAISSVDLLGVFDVEKLLKETKSGDLNEIIQAIRHKDDEYTQEELYSLYGKVGIYSLFNGEISNP